MGSSSTGDAALKGSGPTGGPPSLPETSPPLLSRARQQGSGLALLQEVTGEDTQSLSSPAPQGRAAPPTPTKALAHMGPVSHGTGLRDQGIPRALPALTMATLCGGGGAKELSGLGGGACFWHVHLPSWPQGLLSYAHLLSPKGTCQLLTRTCRPQS